MALVRFAAVFLLSIDAVTYAYLFGLWPALGWLGLVVAARFIPID